MKNRVRIMILLVSAMAFFSCKQEVMTYEEARLQHDRSQEAVTLANPGKMIFVGLDAYIGARIPDSLGSLITGEMVDQHFVKDKITLFNFWFEGCAACIDEIPELNKIVNQFGEKQFNYVAVGREINSKALAVMAQHNWNFEPLSNGDVIIEKEFQPRWGYPTTMVVDQHGIIVSMWKWISERNYDEFAHHLDSLRKAM